MPVYVQLDNHYTATAAAAPAGRTLELVAPPLAKLRAIGNADRAIEQEVRATFLAAIPGTGGRSCDFGAERYVRIAPVVSPGLPAPLAWTLSDMSRDDLKEQLAKALKQDAGKLSTLLGGGALSCR